MKKSFALILLAFILSLHLARTCEMLCLSWAAHGSESHICKVNPEASQKDCHSKGGPSIGCDCPQDDGAMDPYFSLTSFFPDVRPHLTVISGLEEITLLYSIEAAPAVGPPRALA